MRSANKILLLAAAGGGALLLLSKKAQAAVFSIGDDVQIKPGVNLIGLQPQMTIALQVADEAYTSRGFTMTITSANDSVHMGDGSGNSLHSQGLAVDLRTKDLPDAAAAQEIATEIRSRLGSQFDVVLESDHIHVEFDPK